MHYLLLLSCTPPYLLGYHDNCKLVFLVLLCYLHIVWVIRWWNSNSCAGGCWIGLSQTMHQIILDTRSNSRKMRKEGEGKNDLLENDGDFSVSCSRANKYVYRLIWAHKLALRVFLCTLHLNAFISPVSPCKRTPKVSFFHCRMFHCLHLVTSFWQNKEPCPQCRLLSCRN